MEDLKIANERLHVAIEVAREARDKRNAAQEVMDKAFRELDDAANAVFEVFDHAGVRVMITDLG